MSIPGMSAAGPLRRGDVRVVTLNLWGGYYPLRQQVIGRMRPGGEQPVAWTCTSPRGLSRSSPA